MYYNDKFNSFLKEYKKEITGAVFLAASLLTVFFVYFVSSVDEIFFDSAYQYFLNQHSLKELIKLIPQDYNPPFYAIVLKLFTIIINDNSLIAMRALSVVPIIGSLYLAAFPMQKATGAKASLICTAFLAFSPVNFYFIREIRPIGFGAFFVFGAAVYALLALKFNDKKYYAAVTAFSVLSMYTHNIAMLACIGIYAAVILMSIIKKDFKMVRKFILSGICAAVVYIPWLAVVMRQYGRSQDLTVPADRSLVQYLGMLFAGSYRVLIFVIMLIALAVFVIAFKYYRNKELSQKLRELSESELFEMLLASVLIFAAVVVVYYVFNVLVLHLLVRRYTYTFISLLFIVLSIIIAKIDVKRFTLVCLVIIIADFATIGTADINKRAQSQKSEMISDIQSTANKQKQVAFLHFDDHSVGVTSYYFPNAKHYVCSETFTVLKNYDVYGGINIIRIDKPSDIFKYEDSFIFIYYSYEGNLVTVRNAFSDIKIKTESQKIYKLAHSYESVQVDKITKE